MFEETVGYDKETVAFNKAVLYIKKTNRLFYRAISEQIGLTKEQGEQIRAGRRRASNKDIEKLIKAFPESATFFVKERQDAILGHDENPPVTQTANEPMETRFYGKKPEPWEELVQTQKKLIEKLEGELVEVKERLRVVEAERKTLVDIVSQRK